MIISLFMDIAPTDRPRCGHGRAAGPIEPGADEDVARGRLPEQENADVREHRGHAVLSS
jgi:hypothetical protein